jgi:CRISPR-associated protein Csm2
MTRPQTPNTAILSEEEAKAIIVTGNMQLLIKKAEELGSRLQADGLTTSQIRNFFSEVRNIQNRWRSQPQEAFRSTALLKPKLAYAARRAQEIGKKTTAVEKLYQAFNPCIEIIVAAPDADRKGYFENFVNFFEAILAYHKYAGGREH